MARQTLRVTRGTAAQVAAYTGPAGEPVHNSDTKRIHVQDGGTPGGIPQAKLADLFTLGISRADIAINVIPLNSFVLAGFYAVGDGGAGARYVRGAAGDFLAIQDAAGVWFKLDVRGGRLRMGWLGMVANDASAATAAANAAAMNGAMKALDAVCRGGTIEGSGYFYVSATIDNRYPRIMVEGPGRDFAHDVGSAPMGLTFAATGAIEVLRHRTPNAAEAGVPAGQNQKVSGGGFRRLTVVGGSRCLRVTSTAFGVYDVSAMNATGTEAVLFDCLPDYRRPDVSQMGEASDTQHAYIHLRLRQDGDAATRAADCLVFRGYNGCGNPSYIFGATVEARHADGVGVRIENGDNIVFQNLRTAQVGGTGKSFLIQAATTSGGFSGVNDAIEFEHYGSNSVGYVEGVADRANATTPGELTIWKADASNGTQPPTAGVGAYLTIHEINGLTLGLSHAGFVAGETLNSAFQGRRRRRASTTAHLFNVSNDHACLDDGTNRWGISLDSATGNLRLMCEAGSGVVQVPRLAIAGILSASSDADANTKGVKIGETYLNTTSNALRPRTA